MKKEKNINIEELYFYICALSNNTNEVSILVKTEEIDKNLIFFVHNADELFSRLSIIDYPFELFLSYVDADLLKVALENRFCQSINIPQKLFKEFQNYNFKVKPCLK